VIRQKEDHHREEQQGPYDPETEAAGFTIRRPQDFQKSQAQDRVPDHASDSIRQHFGVESLMGSRIHA
jgi:hypothetical protein